MNSNPVVSFGSRGMEKAPSRRRGGFTLIELLITCSVIAVVAAIAIPQFAAYRSRALCGKAMSDLTNLAVAQESYFIFAQTYVLPVQNADNSSDLPGHKWTPGVILVSSQATDFYWEAVTDHPACNDGPYTYSSDKGGLQRK